MSEVQAVARDAGRSPAQVALAWLRQRPVPIYAWAIETVDGVIIVDTGETAQTREPGYFPRLHPYFRLAVRLDVTPEQMVRGRRPEYRLRNCSRRFSAAHP